MSIPEDAAPLVFSPAIFCPGNRVEILRDGAEAYPRMLQDVRSAQISVELEMYTFASDLIGWRFARALAERDVAGIQVRVIYDSLGSRDSTDEVFRFMLHHGIEYFEYNPTFPRRWSLFRKRRDHRKLLIVDGRVAHVGGINLSNEYAPLDSGGGGWRDTMARVEGPVVADLRSLFLRTWSTGPIQTTHTRPTPAPSPDPDGTVAAVMGSQRWRDRRSIARQYIHALSKARRRVWISNAYFLPDRRFLRALRDACRRGVDVRILLPSRSDAWPVGFASAALFGRLLACGARIFRWTGPMLHAKTAVVDGVWSLIGSFNLDHLSLFNNLELTLIALGRPMGDKMEAMFESDLSHAHEVKLQEWRDRPILRRFVERACYALRLLM